MADAMPDAMSSSARRDLIYSLLCLALGFGAAWWGRADIADWGTNRFGVGLLVAGTFTVVGSSIWVLAGLVDWVSGDEPVIDEVSR